MLAVQLTACYHFAGYLYLDNGALPRVPQTHVFMILGVQNKLSTL